MQTAQHAHERTFFKMLQKANNNNPEALDWMRQNAKSESPFADFCIGYMAAADTSPCDV